MPCLSLAVDLIVDLSSKSLSTRSVLERYSQGSRIIRTLQHDRYDFISYHQSFFVIMPLCI